MPVGELVADWHGSEPATVPPIQGRQVRLTPLAPVHDVDLFLALAAEGCEWLWTYRPTPMPDSVAAMATEVRRVLADPTHVFVPTEGPLAGRPAGMASYLRIDPVNGSAEIGGVILAPGLQRTRAATEALHLMMARVFELGHRRLEWKCDSLNEPSRRAAARFGFRYEGRFAQHLVVKGRNRDTDWFSITDAEWPEVARAHQQWLAEENFDADGQQRTSLSDLTAHMADSRLT